MNPNPPNNETDQPTEVMPPSAILALERASIDSQVATAHQWPRSLQNFRNRAVAMATLDTETADECVYCRPVGKEKNDKGVWVQKFAEGPSIRLAEIVATNYGNLRVAAQIVEQTDRFVRCAGVAHDLETNYAGKSECVEVTVDKEGRPYSERQRALIAKVCLAKAYRDAIFKVVPRALCKPIYDAAVKVAAGQDKTISARRDKAKAWIGSLKVDEARMFAALGIQSWDDVGEDQLRILTGIKTAMADKDTTIDEAFPVITKEAETTPKEPVTAAGKAAAVKKEKPAVAPVASMPSAPPPQHQAAQEAQAQQQAATPPAQQTTGSADESKQALDNVKQKLQAGGVTEEVFMRYAEANKIAKKGQAKLADLSTAKLIQIASVFERILPELKKFQEGQQPPAA